MALVAASPAWAQVRNVTVAWDPNNDALTVGYLVSVGNTPGEPLATLDAGAATSVQLPLPIGARYYVAVRAYGQGYALGHSTPEILVDLRSLPGPPAGLRADVSGASVSLSWSESSTGGAPLGYLLSAGTSPGAMNIVASAPIGNVQSFASDAAPGTYFVRVQGANLLGAGPPSVVTVSVGGGFRPMSPVGLQVNWTGSVVTLTWSAPSGDPALVPTTYAIEAGSSPGTSDVGQLNVGSAMSFSADVPPGTYFVRVRGINARGVSDPSNEVVVRR